MNLATEKAAVLKRIEEVEDPNLIVAVKNLLDAHFHEQDSEQALFESSLHRALEQSLRGEVFSHEQVMKEIKANFKL